MIQLKSIPSQRVLCGLFHISDGDGTRYFTTFVRLMEELLLEVHPVNDAVIERLKTCMPGPFGKPSRAGRW